MDDPYGYRTNFLLKKDILKHENAGLLEAWGKMKGKKAY